MQSRRFSIIFLSANYPPASKGGGEISTHLIAKSLVKRGHKVQVVTEGNDTKKEKINYDGVDIIKIPIAFGAKPLFERRYSRKIAKILESVMVSVRNFDVIHAHDFRTALVLSELEYGNSVVTARDYAQICGTTNNVLWDGTRCHCSLFDILRTQRVREVGFPRNLARVWQYRYNVGYRRNAFRKFKTQIFISKAQQVELMEQQDFENQNQAVIYNPVQDQYLTDPVKEGDAGSILYVGRVETYKGIELLLNAWRKVSAFNSNVRLKIVGQGAQRVYSEKFVTNMGMKGSVKFEGQIPWAMMKTIYDHSEILVAPHLWGEPFGRNVAEAMSRGKIVVAANSGGPSEIIVNGSSGILFKTGSEAALVMAIKKVLEMPEREKRKMRMAARERISEIASSELIVKKYESIYSSVISDGSR